MSEDSNPRSIPAPKEKLLELLLEDVRLTDDERRSVRRLCRMLESLFHCDFHVVKERMKSAFHHFDREVSREFGRSEPEVRSEAAAQLAGDLEELLVRANYTCLSMDEIDQAMRQKSLFKLAVRVNVDDFEECVVYRRGMVRINEVLPVLFGLKQKTFVVPAYDRVCILVRFKDKEHFDAIGRRRLSFRPGSLYLKLFRRIPTSDLEMLFPNAEVRMRPLDHLLIGVPAVAGLVHFLFFKIGLAGLIALVTGVLFFVGLRAEEPDMKALLAATLTLGLLLGYLVRQWNNFKNRKLYFLKVLTENLYFRNLDSGVGVLFHLLDVAEEAEVKEAILAYAFLRRSESGLTHTELDVQVQEWLKLKVAKDVNFEHDDALAKLDRLGLTREDQGKVTALPLAEALATLDRRWDSLFDENGRSTLEPAGGTSGSHEST